MFESTARAKPTSRYGSWKSSKVAASFNVDASGQLALLTIGLCNFFSPNACGLTVEPGRRLGRPFDEIAENTLGSVERWLREMAPSRLGANRSIAQILDLE